MIKQFYTPNNTECIGRTDSVSIQRAVDKARESGLDTVVIPRYNLRTGKNIWIIDETILLPSCMTIILEGCHIRMADGAVCNMFANSNARTEIGNTTEGEQHDIAIIGRGQAVLDGGEPNGLSEFTSMKDGRPHISQNLTIYLHNVTRFIIEGFSVVDQRWWAMAFMYARSGRVGNLNFRLTRHAIDSKTQWRNQDGIDLRVGCSDIEIYSISGEVGDDMIALTALNGIHFEEKERVEGADTDIHDVIIRDVRGVTNMCAIIRLLCQYGNKIYNITMRDIYDVARPGKESRAQMLLRIGDEGYYRGDESLRAKPGDICNISAENLYTSAMAAIVTAVGVRNFTAKNIHVRGIGGYVWACGHYTVNKSPRIFHPDDYEQHKTERCIAYKSLTTTAENVVIEDVFYEAGDFGAEALFSFSRAALSDVTISRVHNASSLPLLSFSDMEDAAGDIKLL